MSEGFVKGGRVRLTRTLHPYRTYRGAEGTIVSIAPVRFYVVKLDSDLEVVVTADEIESLEGTQHGTS